MPLWQLEPAWVSWSVAALLSLFLRAPPRLSPRMRRFCAWIAGHPVLLALLFAGAALGASFVAPSGWIVGVALSPFPLLLEAGKLQRAEERLGSLVAPDPEASCRWIGIALPREKAGSVKHGELARYFLGKTAALVPWKEETVREIDSLGLWPWTCRIEEEFAGDWIGAMERQEAKEDARENGA